MNENLSEAISEEQAIAMIMGDTEPEEVETDDEALEGISDEVDTDEVQPDEDEVEDTDEVETDDEADSDEVEEDGEEEAEEEDETEADPILKVSTVEGEVNIPQSEVIAGYMRQKDYTQKTMEVANDRKAVQVATDNAAQLEQQLKQNLEYWATPTQQEPDWGALAEAGHTPATIFKAQGEWQQQQRKRQEAAQMHQALQQQEQAKSAQAMQERSQEQLGKLVTARPELADPAKMNEFGSKLANGALTHYGISESDIKAIESADQLLILADALKYRALDEGKAAVAKKVASAPKKLKAGAKPKKQASAKVARQKIEARAAKGDEDAILQLIMSGQ